MHSIRFRPLSHAFVRAPLTSGTIVVIIVHTRQKKRKRALLSCQLQKSFVMTAFAGVAGDCSPRRNVKKNYFDTDTSRQQREATLKLDGVRVTVRARVNNPQRFFRLENEFRLHFLSKEYWFRWSDLHRDAIQTSPKISDHQVRLTVE